MGRIRVSGEPPRLCRAAHCQQPQSPGVERDLESHAAPSGERDVRRERLGGRMVGWRGGVVVMVVVVVVGRGDGGVKRGVGVDVNGG